MIMQIPNSPPSTIPPPSQIKVSIFNTQYTIKQTDNLTEDDIRGLADYVDRTMHQFSQKGYDSLSVAIMAALNIAAQMYGEQKRYADAIRQLTRMMDEAMGDNMEHDTPGTTPTPNPNHPIQSQP